MINVKKQMDEHERYSGSTFLYSKFEKEGVNLDGMDKYAVGFSGETVYGELKAVKLNDFIRRNYDSLDAGVVIGTWYESEENITYIDLVLLFEDREQAIWTARKLGEKAICYLKTQEVIFV